MLITLLLLLMLLMRMFLGKIHHQPLKNSWYALFANSIHSHVSISPQKCNTLPQRLLYSAAVLPTLSSLLYVLCNIHPRPKDTSHALLQARDETILTLRTHVFDLEEVGV
jgi:hypothetical protein